MATLEQELIAFHQKLPELMAQGKRGQFALVRGHQVDSIWATLEQALEAGYDRFGLEPFLVQEITDHEEAQYFSRNLDQCRQN